jgi:hypothetical protein
MTMALPGRGTTKPGNPANGRIHGNLLSASNSEYIHFIKPGTSYQLKRGCNKAPQTKSTDQTHKTFI